MALFTLFTEIKEDKQNSAETEGSHTGIQAVNNTEAGRLV